MALARMTRLLNNFQANAGEAYSGIDLRLIVLAAENDAYR